MTAESEPWHPGFIRRHQGRCPKTKWPAATSADGFCLRREWCRRMVEARVTEDEADLASALVAKDAPKEPASHPGAIVRLVREARDRARGEMVRAEITALKSVAAELRSVERAQVLLNRRAWDRLPVEERARIWEEARELAPLCRLRTFRERAAWTLCGFPDPATEGVRSPGEAREIVAELEAEFGDLYDPTPRAAVGTN